MSATNLAPTYHGYIGSTKDALLIIYQALNQQLELVPRRPHERERPELIKSGMCLCLLRNIRDQTMD